MCARDWQLSFAVLCTHPEMFGFLQGIPNWEVWPCPGARGGTMRKALWTQAVLPRLVRRSRSCLLHSLQFVAPLALSVDRVVTVHDLGYLHYPQTVEEPRRTYYRFLVPHSLRRARHILTNSYATASDVAKTFPEVATRITATPWGTPSWVWDQPPAAARRDEAAPFLFVGTLEPRKNLERILRAYRLLLDRVAATQGEAQLPKLVLAGGKGWHDSSLREQIQQLQERGKLRLEGYCDRQRLWQLLSSARALLFPSLHEGFGFPILEAMTARLPVLTADRGAMREVAGDAALLVDPYSVDAIAEGMARLSTDVSLRRLLMTRGTARARFFTWERTAAATVAVYRQLLAPAVADKPKK
jgi:glycosyltransferase involved in cell wall biosynthesis